MNKNTGYKKTNLGKTTQKYLRYVCDIIDEHGLSGSCTRVNLKDYNILKRYYKGEKKTLSAAYNYMIKKLLDLNIISKPDQKFYFIPNETAYVYDLNKSSLMDILDYYSLSYPDSFNIARVKINGEYKRVYSPKPRINAVKDVDVKNLIATTDSNSVISSDIQQYIINAVSTKLDESPNMTSDELITYVLTPNQQAYPISLKDIKILKHLLSLIRIGKVRISRTKYGITSEFLRTLVIMKYPIIHDYKKFLDEQNIKYNHNEYQYDSAEIKITYTHKNITKIGFRTTNKFAQLPSCHNTIKEKRWVLQPNGNFKLLTIDTGILHDYKGSREEYLDTVISYHNYDVSGSIPFIARAMNKGIIKDLSTDTYKEMYGHCFDKWDTETRKLCKSYSMRMLFGGSVDNIYWKLKRAGSDVDYDFLSMLKDAEIDYCNNKSNDTSAFLYESIIYSIVKYKIEERGIICYQCYDSFYYEEDKISEDQIKDMITETTQNIIINHKPIR